MMQFVEAHGVRIPQIGLGTMTLKEETCVQAVKTALQVGYRHIDTAAFYGNEKENGEGLRASGIKRDQVFNTYFVPYAVGWKSAQPRPPPGISKDNPPDLPPSHPFEMYPSAFLPPFHYGNPVTGNTVAWPPAQ